MRTAILLTFLVLLGCEDTEDGGLTDASTDASTSTDASMDAATDAATDASGDAAMDAGMDAASDASTCTCSTGPCCDGCHVRPNTYVCIDDELKDTYCSGSSVCSGKGLTRVFRYESRYCNGVGTSCNGAWFGERFEELNCSVDQNYATYARCEDPADGEAYCTSGPNCDTEGP
jgi:hypothetical protein